MEIEERPTKIVKDKKHPGMYRLKWKDGTLSEDCYNLTRVTDIKKNYLMYRKNMLVSPPRSLTDALNEVDS